MKVIAVDPGGTTGIARVDTDNLKSFSSTEATSLEALAVLETLISRGQADLVVCEAFIISAATIRKTRQYDALYSIGAIRYFAWTHGVEVDLREPTEREFATNARLATLGWRNPTPGGHADDAARHLLVTGVRIGWIDPAIFTDTSLPNSDPE